jgi:hypothetical protein
VTPRLSPGLGLNPKRKGGMKMGSAKNGESGKKQTWTELLNMLERGEIPPPTEEDLSAAEKIMIGDCPACGSSNITSCEDMPDIDDITMGFCLDCGAFWCSECQVLFRKGQKICEHWALCEDCDHERPKEGCDVFSEDCEKIKQWKSSLPYERKGRKTDQ